MISPSQVHRLEGLSCLFLSLSEEGWGGCALLALEPDVFMAGNVPVEPCSPAALG